MNIEVINDDCLNALRGMPDNSVDAIVTDPPYGLSNTTPKRVAETLAAWAGGDLEYVPTGRGFMGASWDGFVPPPAVWAECYRVLKPGGHMAVFAGARTQDLMGMSIRLAGFDIRDNIAWIYGSGFPKSMSVAKAIESTISTGKSNSRSLRETEQAGDGEAYSLTGKNNGIMGETRTYDRKEFAPATDEAKQWDGWGTALKPAIEPIILARKPLVGTVAANVLAHGVGGLNIDACRVPSDEVTGWGGSGAGGQTWNSENMGLGKDGDARPVLGRFPANVLLDEHAAAEMDKQSGVTGSNFSKRKNARKTEGVYGEYAGGEPARTGPSDTGGASRFFPVFKYQAKAPKKERPVVEREAIYGLRGDLTEDQVDYVLARLREAGVETG